jgi:hypothetical protein
MCWFKNVRDDPNFRCEGSPPKNWGIHIVPERSAFVIKKFGKYFKTLGLGIHFIIPFVEKIAMCIP